VIIATKRGKISITPGSPQTTKDLLDEPKKKHKAKWTTEKDDLDKYRPKNFFNEDTEYIKPDIDDDVFPWESNYQIGIVNRVARKSACRSRHVSVGDTWRRLQRPSSRLSPRIMGRRSTVGDTGISRMEKF
jgi:hypothetical protein